MAEVAKLELNGKVYEFPVIEGSENEKAIDISKLRASTGYITIDPGFKNTGSTKSGITFLNGEEGILRYRGYPIEQVKEELIYVSKKYADRPHHTMYMADENFGILKRDVEIAEAIKKCKDDLKLNIILHFSVCYDNSFKYH